MFQLNDGRPWSAHYRREDVDEQGFDEGRDSCLLNAIRTCTFRSIVPRLTPKDSMIYMSLEDVPRKSSSGRAKFLKTVF
jgi:hypothetical protein